MTIKLTLYSHYINSLLFHMNLLLEKACKYILLKNVAYTKQNNH